MMVLSHASGACTASVLNDPFPWYFNVAQAAKISTSSKSVSHGEI
jgi:H+/gluconate symporter-like permease